MKTLMLGLTAVGILVAGPALAQTTTTTTVVKDKPSAGAGVGVVGGAVTGAVVGGPVGAVVGGVVGGMAGAVVDPPAEVTTYVRTQPGTSYTYDGQIVVGQPLPSAVTVYEVPKYDRYSWAYVNGQRILVDRSSRKVISYVPESTTVVTQKKGSAGAGVGIVSGAATGAAVGGPVGAVVGGVVGGVAGALADPPAEVTTYVRGQNVAPVTYAGPITVGQPMPGTVQVYSVPKYERYSWSFVNGKRILVDNDTKLVVGVID